jgi:hypothetical protein
MTTPTTHRVRTAPEHPLAQARIRSLTARPASPLRVVHRETRRDHRR